MDVSFVINVFGGGLVGLVLYAIAEKFLPIIPSFPFLILIGTLADKNDNGLGISILAITFGSTVGAVALFLIGRRVDEKNVQALATRFGRYVLLTVDRYDRLIASFRRRHFLVVLCSQFVPGARNYTPISAGTVGVAFLPFLCATVIGALIWNAAFVTLGHLLGASF